jgi:hypothetical protein
LGKYSNQFDCIPALLQFRPQRLAIKPRLFGIMNGVIDSEQDLGRADLDEQGRYKVQMPFDISGVAPGMGSRRIRMAQPYGGGGTGMSFPLVKGTEVIWTCIDGDIDRPIITGTVPNPLNSSVTTTENYSNNVIRTASGITMEYQDGRSRSAQNITGGGGGLAEQQQYQNVNQESQLLQGSAAPILENNLVSDLHQNHYLDSQSLDGIAGEKETKGESIEKLMSAPNKNDALELQQQKTNPEYFDRIESPDACFVLHVPGHSYLTGEEADSSSAPLGNGRSYFSMGNMAADSEIAFYSEQVVGGGIYSYTDGARVNVTKGNDTHWHYGSSSDYYSSPQVSFFNDRVSEFYVGTSFDYKAGLIGEISAGVKTALNVHLLDAEINLGAKVTMGAVMDYHSVTGPSVELAGDIVKESNDRINLRCDPDDGKWENFVENVMPAAAAAAALVVVGTGAYATVNEGRKDLGGAGDSAADFSLPVEIATHAIGGICAAIAFADALARRKEKSSGTTDGAAYIDMNAKKINIAVQGVSKKCTPGDTLYAPQDDKILILSAQGKCDGKAEKAVSLALTAGGSNPDHDSIVLACGEGSSITMNSTGITFRVGDNTFVIDKLAVNTEKALVVGGDLGVVGNTTLSGKVGVTKKATFEKAVVIKGELDSATVKNAALTATATAKSASTAESDKLKKDMDKALKAHNETIVENSKRIMRLWK